MRIRKSISKFTGWLNFVVLDSTFERTERHYPRRGAERVGGKLKGMISTPGTFQRTRPGTKSTPNDTISPPLPGKDCLLPVSSPQEVPPSSLHLALGASSHVLIQGHLWAPRAGAAWPQHRWESASPGCGPGQPLPASGMFLCPRLSARGPLCLPCLVLWRCHNPMSS